MIVVIAFAEIVRYTSAVDKRRVVVYIGRKRVASEYTVNSSWYFYYHLLGYPTGFAGMKLTIGEHSSSRDICTTCAGPRYIGRSICCTTLCLGLDPAFVLII